jgi:serine protease Do
MIRTLLVGLFLLFGTGAIAAESLPISPEVGKVLAGRYPENREQLKLLQEQVELVAAQAVAATVEVEIGNSIGSGVIISPKGLVLTAAHVIGGKDRPVTVVLADGRRLKGHTLGAHHNIDAGMIQIDDVPPDLPFAPVVTRDEIQDGEWVVATGQPGGLLEDRSAPVRLGRVLAQGGEWICTDCTLVGGDSGGPLYNMRGEVLAVNMSIGPAAVHNFHVPVAKIRPFWDKMLEGKVWGQGYDQQSQDERVVLGIAGRQMGDRCVVTQVFPGYPAARAGIVVGDVIEAVDKETIESLSELNELILGKEPGDRIRVRVARGDHQVDLRVRLSLIDSPLPGTLDSKAEVDEELLEGDDEEGLGFNYPQERITVPSWRFAHGPHARASFREVVGDARKAVVEIRVDGVKVGLGGIVGAEGYVLTKASSLGSTNSCVLGDGREFTASLVGISRDHDLALLKIDAQELPTLNISEDTVPVVGSWLATVGIDRYPVAVGVVSVEAREIPHQAGILGVQLNSEEGAARIVRVFPGSAAAKAGLLVNDIVTRIEGQETPSREALIQRVQEFSPGDTVELLVKRADEELTLSAVLMGRFPGLRPSRNEFQNRLGGELSERRFGFAQAFQHDTVIEPTDIGGPVVNLDGQVVGFNVARAGRTETYAVPAATLVKVIAELGGSGARP